MSNAVSESTGLVRVTVLRGTRRADLAVPGSVSVADLLPELVGAVGALDPYTVHGGYRLVRSDGASLAPDEGLVTQGVEDGDVLTVAIGVDDKPPRVYDDVVEAVADAVEQQSRPWSPAASRRTALVAAIVALLASAGVLLLLRPEGGAVALGGLVASVLLVTAAAVLGRGQQEHEAALAVAWVAVAFAAVAGLAAYPDAEWTASPLLAAGVLGTGMAALGSAALSRYRILLVPALVLGGTAVGIAAVVIATGWSPAAVAACAATLVVVAGSVVPWASVTTTRLRVPQPRNDAELLADPAPLDGAAVARQVRLGREVLIALMVSVGAVLVLTAPLVVRLGITGTVLVVVSCVAIVLRTRQYRDGVEVGVGVVSAVVALAAAVASAALVHPGWRPVLAGALMLLGAVLLAASATPRAPNVRFGRLGDVVEAVALVVLMPLLVMALGIFGG